MVKPNIEAIFPLTFMQQALLFHSLHESHDQGFLQVRCRLEGPLERTMFEEAWLKAIQRHSVLRTSIHWKEIEKPVQVVHRDAAVPLHFYDWQNLPQENHPEKLLDLQQEDRSQGIDLSKAPAWRLALIQLGAEEHLLLWSCHHLLMDGWSAAVILKDVFACYEAAVKGLPAPLETLPGYKVYLNWLQRQDAALAEKFWQKELGDFEKPTLLGVAPNAQQNGSAVFRDHSVSLTADETGQLQTLLRNYRITLNTFAQGIWAMLLGSFSASPDVVFGTTVSGRPAELPNIGGMAGMFMNVIPVRVRLRPEMNFADWLADLQTSQTMVRNQEHVTMSQICSWIAWPGHVPLFDSLLVVENFPWENLAAGNLTMQEFEGGITTTYPLTIVVKPGKELVFTLRRQENMVSEGLTVWLSTQLEMMLKAVIAQQETTLADRMAGIKRPQDAMFFAKKTEGPAQKTGHRENDVKAIYTAPKNAVELQLTKIWEEVFGLRAVSMDDNFFETGGTSLQAVRMFAKIEQELGRNLPPVTLLQNPTIRQLAAIFEEEKPRAGWSSLVPLRASGDKPPLFCIHAGGAHVFFYKALASHLSPDQPVYAMQPLGLDDVSACHLSIEEMAAHYTKEVMSVQAEGPVALLGSCFSNPVCLEMAEMLRANGREVALLVIVDSPPNHFIKITPATRLQRLMRLMKQIGKGRWKDIFYKLHWQLIHPIQKKISYSLEDKQTQNLISLREILESIAEKYIWKPYAGKITLIRSTEFHNWRDQDHHIRQWTAIAGGGLDVFVVEGHHSTLFDEPEVQGLAKVLQEKLDAGPQTFTEVESADYQGR